MAITAAQFPRYSRVHSTLNNMLVTRQPLIELDVAGESTLLMLGIEPGPVGSSHLIGLTAADARLWLELSSQLFERLCANWAGGVDINPLPVPLRQAVLNAAIGPFCDALAAASGIVAVVTQNNDYPPENILRLGLWPPSGTGRLPEAVLYLDEAAVAALLETLTSMPAAINGLDWAELPTDLTIAVGQLQLPAGSLPTITHGDVLLLPPSLSGTDYPLVLRQGTNILAEARLDGRRLIIDRLMEATMSENEQADAAESPPMAIDPQALDIRIQFDLGHL
ncbi:MAG: hypothetical protein HC808_08320, partial [Candidatus Competibacteraceae bacterium]|nr:hypothetical protein [Candidatus Competibacteraceae bacterium]